MVARLCAASECCLHCRVRRATDRCRRRVGNAGRAVPSPRRSLAGMTSTAVPPWPKSSTGPNSGSMLAPTMSSCASGRRTIRWTAKPVRRASDSARTLRSKSVATAAGPAFLKSSRTRRYQRSSTLPPIAVGPARRMQPGGGPCSKWPGLHSGGDIHFISCRTLHGRSLPSPIPRRWSQSDGRALAFERRSTGAFCHLTGGLLLGPSKTIRGVVAAVAATTLGALVLGMPAPVGALVGRGSDLGRRHRQLHQASPRCGAKQPRDRTRSDSRSLAATVGHEEPSRVDLPANHRDHIHLLRARDPPGLVVSPTRTARPTLLKRVGPGAFNRPAQSR